MKINDLTFKPFISKSRVKRRVRQLAEQINADYQGKNPVFIPILNGSFMFASDLMKHVSLRCRICFVKVSSYSGTASTGQLKTLIGVDESFFNQDLIIIEDIIDSGLTLQKIVSELQSLGARTVEIVSLLRKQPARDKNVPVKYVGFEIENEFVLGYGLDYDGLGRNTAEIYQASRPV